MIRHLVLFRFHEGVSATSDGVREAVELMADLPARIPAIRAWRHGLNVTADEQAWDYALQAGFDDEAALHAYFDHPAHQPVLSAWEAVAELAFCDIRL